ncbi:MAG: putative tricarboxylic transport rane protein [Clostridia bacterium]|nr:putative tricarboxylic transport rane protein [Clostridia bacterium]
MKKGTLVINVLFIVASVFLFIETFKFPYFKGPVGPAGMPRLLIFILVALNLISIWQNRSLKDDKPVKIESPWRIIAGTALILLYLALFNSLGYFVVTPLFLIAMMFLMQVRRPVMVISVAVIFTLVVYFFFYKELMLPLPLGLLG